VDLPACKNRGETLAINKAFKDNRQQIYSDRPSLNDPEEQELLKVEERSEILYFVYFVYEKVQKYEIFEIKYKLRSVDSV
jgi:hypothetical protein